MAGELPACASDTAIVYAFNAGAVWVFYSDRQGEKLIQQCPGAACVQQGRNFGVRVPLDKGRFTIVAVAGMVFAPSEMATLSLSEAREQGADVLHRTIAVEDQ